MRTRLPEATPVASHAVVRNFTLAAMSRPQLGKPILDDIASIARLHCGCAAEQVRMSSIAPPVDCGEVEITGRRVGLWKSSRDQIG